MLNIKHIFFNNLLIRFLAHKKGIIYKRFNPNHLPSKYTFGFDLYSTFIY